MKKLIMFITMAVIATEIFAQINVNNSGDVGIGTSSPSSKLYIYDNGTAEVRLQASSSNLSRFWALNSIYSYGFGVDGSANGHIYANINSPESLITFSRSNVGIGRTPSSSYKLDINGDIRVNTTVYDSDKRLKTNIKILDEQSNNLFKLEGVSYNFKQMNGNAQDTLLSVKNTDNAKTNRIHYGFIAQDVQNIYPDLIYEDDEGILGIDYVSLIPLIVKELKEQQAEIENLKEQLASIEENCCDNNLKSASLGSEVNSKSDGIEAQLSQNIPNPFSQVTKINCVIPSESNNVNLYVYNMQGIQLQHHKINGTGEQCVVVNAKSLKPGIYLYSLVINGKEIDTKKMMLTE